MIEFINAITGTQMWVTDERKEEYLAAGHKLAAMPAPVAAIEPKEEEKPVKKTGRRSTKK